MRGGDADDGVHLVLDHEGEKLHEEDRVLRAVAQQVDRGLRAPRQAQLRLRAAGDEVRDDALHVASGRMRHWEHCRDEVLLIATGCGGADCFETKRQQALRHRCALGSGGKVVEMQIDACLAEARVDGCVGLCKLCC